MSVHSMQHRQAVKGCIADASCLGKLKLRGAIPIDAVNAWTPTTSANEGCSDVRIITGHVAPDLLANTTASCHVAAYPSSFHQPVPPQLRQVASMDADDERERRDSGGGSASRMSGRRLAGRTPDRQGATKGLNIFAIGSRACASRLLVRPPACQTSMHDVRAACMLTARCRMPA